MVALQGRRAPDELWRAIGDPSRRRVLDLLVTRGQTTQTALATRLPLTRQAIAKHLAVLRKAGLVSAKRDGRETRYRVRPRRVRAATRALAAQAARWEDALSSRERAADRAASGTAPTRVVTSTRRR